MLAAGPPHARISTASFDSPQAPDRNGGGRSGSGAVEQRILPLRATGRFGGRE